MRYTVAPLLTCYHVYLVGLLYLHEMAHDAARDGRITAAGSIAKFSTKPMLLARAWASKVGLVQAQQVCKFHPGRWDIARWDQGVSSRDSSLRVNGTSAGLANE